MASNPIGREAQPVTLPGMIPPMPAVARILSRYDRPALESFLLVAIDLLDAFDRPADPDEPDFSPRSDGQPGDPGDHEPGGDDEGGAYIEWITKPSNLRRKGQGELLAGHEDAEEDDPAGQYDEDYYTGPAMPDRGAGCPISDPGEYEDGF